MTTRNPKNVNSTMTISPWTLGYVGIAMRDDKIHAIFLGDAVAPLETVLKAKFASAVLNEDLSNAQQTLLEKIITALENPHTKVNLPLEITGTPFQQRVWQALTEIPIGKTVTYTTLAQSIGLPLATRAVANACGANKLAVVIPCHRVIRQDGSLGGYRWGIECKRQLLAREQMV